MHLFSVWKRWDWREVLNCLNDWERIVTLHTSLMRCIYRSLAVLGIVMLMKLNFPMKCKVMYAILQLIQIASNHVQVFKLYKSANAIFGKNKVADHGNNHIKYSDTVTQWKQIRTLHFIIISLRIQTRTLCSGLHNHIHLKESTWQIIVWKVYYAKNIRQLFTSMLVNYPVAFEVECVAAKNFW